ncbi:transglycosylase domain-containing protein [Bifidobacterium sp. ESL0763]|uniref:transglycosylase domain-containing protein n=1 Tax=Bifidobacterium sp. ESL0763 TaxID=2983227 RepID=UPI0023FA0090|nr:transglycosylase domain-containing protein [Bifidobacterium sp. ESL0763]MDF7663407.1 transglycosylase domain-containing protein [Bifidobacterium sp. ESL0763]
MSESNNLTVRRVLALLLTYVTLCFAGGVVGGLFFVPGVIGANHVARAIVPSLKIEGIDFDVTSLPQRSTLYASDGTTVIASFYAQNRTVVPLRKISQPMQQAVVAREDRRFFEHAGVDVQGVLRAFIQTFVKHGATQGGSSLTQQYVKNALMVQAREDDDPIAEYHASEETIARKVREMLIAVQIEKQYSKAEILQGYLNIAQFGSNNLYGVETAAKRYFGVSAADLNIGQAATIAAITKNPSQYDPSIPENQPEAQKQRNIVLDLMLQQGFISQSDHDKFHDQPIQQTLNLQDNTTNIGCQSAGDAAFFCDYVTKQILNSPEFGKTTTERNRLLTEGGLNIYTTMDVHANADAMSAARDTIPVDDPSHFEVTMASIKPGTGEVLGFGINRIYDATDAAKGSEERTAVNYAVDEKDGGGTGWGVGSTWKPINMVAWMEQGKPITQQLRLSTYYPVGSFSCANYPGQSFGWNVHNSEGGSASVESPLQGLIRSHNTTQAGMTQQIGLCSVADAAKQMGYHNASLANSDITTPATLAALNGPMVIGSVNADPLTMANVYATIGANGVECTPIALKKVISKSGKSLKVPSANCHQAISPEIAQTTAYALNQGVVQPGGEASMTQLDGGRKTFAKTGTNEDTYMTTAGFVPNQVATFVTVGNAEHQESFNGKVINHKAYGTWYGMYIATPAWKEFMNRYLADAGIPIDNNYGNADPKYMSGGSSSTYGGTSGNTFGNNNYTMTNGNRNMNVAPNANVTGGNTLGQTTVPGQ